MGAVGFHPRSMISPTLVAEVALAHDRGDAPRGAALGSIRTGGGRRRGLRTVQPLLPAVEVMRFPILADDLAVIGGRHAVSALAEKDLSGIPDIVLDVSALSISVYHPAFAFVPPAGMFSAGTDPR